MIKNIFNLKDTCSIVTGSAQGLGKAMATALANYGSNIVVADINYENSIEAAKDIEKLGVKAIPVKADITNEDDINCMVNKTLERFDRIDILINNAGIFCHRNAEDMEYDEWQNVINVNLNGTFLVSKIVGKVMIKQNHGSIINNSSMSGIIVNTPQNQAAYNVSKAGVIMLTKSLASEWVKYNIRVNAIAPGYMNTGKVKRRFIEKDELAVRWGSLTPMRRPGEPEELGGIVVFLASDASSYITGGVFPVDGGYTIW